MELDGRRMDFERKAMVKSSRGPPRLALSVVVLEFLVSMVAGSRISTECLIFRARMFLFQRLGSLLGWEARIFAGSRGLALTVVEEADEIGRLA